MTKRSKVTLFGLLALIAAFGLILTGCPDANGGGDSGSGYEPPTAIKLASGSHGTEGNASISALTASGKYVVFDTKTNRWYGVLTDGTLGRGITLTAATTEAAVLGNDAEGAPLTVIADPLLNNGNTYSVYAVVATSLSTGDTIGDTTGTLVTGGKNTIVTNNILTAGNNTVNFTAGAGKNSSIVFLIAADSVLKANAGATVTTTAPVVKMRGTASKKDFTITATAGSAVIKASRVGDDALVLTGITSAFAGSIASTTQPAAVTLATTSSSKGTPGDDSITGFVAETDKLVISQGTNWYGVKATGLRGAVRTNPQAAAADAETLGASITAITGLFNDETYEVFLVTPPLAANSIIINTGTGDFLTNAKNVIVDYSVITAGRTTGHKIQLKAGTFPTSPGATVYFINTFAATADASDAIADGAIAAFNTNDLAWSEKAGTADPVYTVKSGETWIKVTGLYANVAATLAIGDLSDN